ncbi:HupE/UreJ family protein [Pseudorhodobacter sp. W20_MBD10_FR17]|uniref:HupE/UreJ family protein n=1 Tax=Pseudorhodobacter sp. W20_MBD10_FR17 TaxID=3240266 RepID=UPI003F992791
MLRGPVFTLIVIMAAGAAWGHGVTGGDQAYMIASQGIHPFPFMYLGAKHMVTGYDHLLYLAGVIFFLRHIGDVAKFVSLFAVGHSITLLYGVLSGTQVNVYLVDAIIGLSICYKALENLTVIRWLDARIAVFGFGLIHGFGLSSKLQDLALPSDGLVGNMIFFNIGVEIGQVIALVALFSLSTSMRGLRFYDGIAQYINIGLFGAGLVLFGYQLTGFFITWR